MWDFIKLKMQSSQAISTFASCYLFLYFTQFVLLWIFYLWKVLKPSIRDIGLIVPEAVEANSILCPKAFIVFTFVSGALQIFLLTKHSYLEEIVTEHTEHLGTWVKNSWVLDTWGGKLSSLWDRDTSWIFNSQIFHRKEGINSIDI